MKAAVVTTVLLAPGFIATTIVTEATIRIPEVLTPVTKRTTTAFFKTNLTYGCQVVSFRLSSDNLN